MCIGEASNIRELAHNLHSSLVYVPRLILQ